MGSRWWCNRENSYFLLSYECKEIDTMTSDTTDLHNLGNTKTVKIIILEFIFFSINVNVITSLECGPCGILRQSMHAWCRHPHDERRTTTFSIGSNENKPNCIDYCPMNWENNWTIIGYLNLPFCLHHVGHRRKSCIVWTGFVANDIWIIMHNYDVLK